MRTVDRAAAAAATLALALAGCAQPAAHPAEPVPHGYVEGATEVAEPALSLVEIGADGTVVLRDLLTGEATDLPRLDPVDTVATDGRLVFAGSAAAGTVTVLDSGVWTVDHQDHSHYYRAEPRTVGTVAGRGSAVVRPGSARTVVAFPEQGRAVVLDTAALGRGEIAVTDELAGARGEVAAIGEVLLVADAATGILTAVAPDGQEVARTDCVEPRGAATTRVGVVVGCAHGAVLATQPPRRPAQTALESVPYPAGLEGLRAGEFRGRKGRPAVAAVAGDRGAWVLDTRARSWTLLESPVPLVQASAAADADGHVVGVAADGTVVVLTPDGGRAVTVPLLATSLAAGAPGVELTVDAHRAYVNAPADGAVHEIDYADAARVARTFPSDAAFLAETGR